MVDVVTWVTVSGAVPLLDKCTASVGVKVAVIVWGLVPSSWVVTVAVQVAALAPLFVSVQALNVSPFVPVSEDVRAIVPAGLDVVPDDVSVTVMVTVPEPPAATLVGLRATTVDVVRLLTVNPLVRVLVPPPVNPEGAGFVTDTL